jgi:hypothetical protein
MSIYMFYAFFRENVHAVLSVSERTINHVNIYKPKASCQQKSTIMRLIGP